MAAQAKCNWAKVREICLTYQKKFQPLIDDACPAVRLAGSLLGKDQPLGYLLKLSVNDSPSPETIGVLGSTLLGTLHRLRAEEPYVAEVSASATLLRAILAELSVSDPSLRPQGQPATGPVWLTPASTEGILAACQSLGKISAKKEVVQGGALGRVLELTEIGGDLGNLQSIAARCARNPVRVGARVQITARDQLELEGIRGRLRTEMIELRALKDRGGYAQHIILSSVLANMELIVAILDASAPTDWPQSETDQQENERLRRLLDGAKEELSGTRRDAEGLTNKATTLEKKLVAAESALRESRGIVESMVAKEQKLERKLKSALSELKIKTQAAVELQQKLVQFETDQGRATEKLHQIEIQNKSLSEAVDLAETELKESRLRAIDLQKERDSLLETTEQLTVKIEQLLRELAEQGEALTQRELDYQSLMMELEVQQKSSDFEKDSLAELTSSEKSMLEEVLARHRQRASMRLTSEFVKPGVID